MRAALPCLVLCACVGARGDAPPAPTPAPEVPGPAAPAVPFVGPDLSPPTCPIRQLTPQPLDLRATVELGHAAGKRWLAAERAGAPALLHLGPDGALTHTPLARWTEEVGLEPDGALRLFYTTAPTTWARVDLRAPDAPVVAAATELPGLTAGEYPKGVASDGTRALVSLYRASKELSGPRYLGETALLSVPAGERIGPLAAMTVWTAHCAGGRCYGVATANDDQDARAVVVLDETGPLRVGTLGRWDCTGVETWLDGQAWMIAWAERRAAGIAALDLTTGLLTTATIPTGDPDCAAVQALAAGVRRGIVVAAPHGGRAFVAVGSDLRPGPLEPLPDLRHHRQRFAASGAGALVLSYTAASGLVHDSRPDPQGNREYNHVWSFSGVHGFLRPGAAWTLEDTGPLPHDGESGDLTSGYDVIPVTRPGHAGVLVVADGGPSAYYPLRKPCPAGQVR